MGSLQVIEVDADNVEDVGFFCRMSKMKTPANQRKLAWAKKRFGEGMDMTLLKAPGRGFVEVMPIERCWRPIKGTDWDVIHCLWVVGKSKGQGHGRALLDLVEKRAKKAGRAGVCTVTREKNWVTPRSFYDGKGFTVIDEGPDGFVLMAKTFQKGAALPRFATRRWSGRAAKHGDGLVVFLADQCPYLGDATQAVQDVGKKLRLPVTLVELKSAAQVRSKAPSPYGVFAIVLDGEVISYKYELPADLEKLIRARRKAA